MNHNSKGTALITGASLGIGAVYAERLSRLGHDLILVAPDRERLETLAAQISGATGRSVRVMAADLNDKADLSRVEQVLRTDAGITVLVNSAGIGDIAPLVDSDLQKMDRMVDLNVTVVVHLTHAAVPAFLKRGGGTIINIASTAGIAPELLNGVYGGTGAFVVAFTQSLHNELSKSKVRVQAVLPGATATGEIVMQAEDVVDAAIAGLDQGEVVTIPSLPDIGDWEAYEAARQKMLPQLSLRSPAPRYGPAGGRPQPIAKSAEERLAASGHELPPAVTPFGAYVPAVRTGNLLFLSGMLPTVGHKPKFVGRLGKELNVEQGRCAAIAAALNVLAVARQHLGSLDRISRVVRLGVSIATDGEFRDEVTVADAASEVLREVFGEDKMSSRLVLGMKSLPFGVPVELETIFEVAA